MNGFIGYVAFTDMHSKMVIVTCDVSVADMLKGSKALSLRLAKKAYCTRRILYKEEIVQGGYCTRRKLYKEDIVQGGYCTRRILYRGTISSCTIQYCTDVQ